MTNKLNWSCPTGPNYTHNELISAFTTLQGELVRHDTLAELRSTGYVPTREGSLILSLTLTRAIMDTAKSLGLTLVEYNAKLAEAHLACGSADHEALARATIDYLPKYKEESYKKLLREIEAIVSLCRLVGVSEEDIGINIKRGFINQDPERVQRHMDKIAEAGIWPLPGKDNVVKGDFSVPPDSTLDPHTNDGATHDDTKEPASPTSPGPVPGVSTGEDSGSETAVGKLD